MEYRRREEKPSVTNLHSSWDTIIHGAGSYAHVSQHSQRVPRKRRVNLIQTQILCEKHGALDFFFVEKGALVQRRSWALSRRASPATTPQLTACALLRKREVPLPEAGLRSHNQAHSRGSVLECKSLCFNHIRLSSHLAHHRPLFSGFLCLCEAALSERQRQGWSEHGNSTTLQGDFYFIYLFFRLI